MSKIPHHTSKKKGTYSEEHGTPEHLLDLFRPIAVDLASSRELNKRVRAAAYFTKRKPCPPSIIYLPFSPGNLWCNPPGGVKAVSTFFATWVEAAVCFQRAGFLIYNSDHWRSLFAHKPFVHSVTVLFKRQRFYGAKHQATFPSVLVSHGVPQRELKNLGHVMKWRSQ